METGQIKHFCPRCCARASRVWSRWVLPASVCPPLSRRFLPRIVPPRRWASPWPRASAESPWWARGAAGARTPGPAGPAPPAGPPWAATARARPGAAGGRSWPRLWRRCPAAHGGLQSRRALRVKKKKKRKKKRGERKGGRGRVRAGARTEVSPGSGLLYWYNPNLQGWRTSRRTPQSYYFHPAPQFKSEEKFREQTGSSELGSSVITAGWSRTETARGVQEAVDRVRLRVAWPFPHQAVNPRVTWTSKAGPQVAAGQIRGARADTCDGCVRAFSPSAAKIYPLQLYIPLLKKIKTERNFTYYFVIRLNSVNHFKRKCKKQIFLLYLKMCSCEEEELRSEPSKNPDGKWIAY